VTTARTPRSSTAWRVAAAALGALVLAAIVRLSWLGDDAFITFRSVENMVAGNGPVWNVDDRVQTYTHPLWFALLCVVRWITGELPTSSQVLGIVTSSAALVWLARTIGTAPAIAFVLTACLGSRAFCAYATSGLETSLTFLLIAAFVAANGVPDPARRLARTALVAGALATTRLDLIVLVAPAIAANLRGVPARAAIRALAIGAAPLAVWSAFATVYYGSPFPITAFAKAFCHGVPAGELALQGLRYLQNGLTADPVTPAAIAAGIVLGLLRPGRRALAVGALAYVAYVVKVGGDYMQGRFLVPPFFAALAVLGAEAAAARTARVGFAMLALGALAFVPGLPRTTWFDGSVEPFYAPGPDGIVAEEIRGQWDHGILSSHRVESVFGSHGATLRAPDLDRPMITVWGSMGWTGFRAGTVAHYVDPWLCDPLIARLPIADPSRWRIGHFYRNIPAGYLESLATGTNVIAHPGLAALWDAVRSASRDPVWSAARWGHLWDLWTGRLDAGVADYVATRYRTPPRIEVALADFPPPPQPDTWWFVWPRSHSAQTGGLAVRLPEATTARSVVAHVSPGGYEVTFRRGGATVGTGRIVAGHGPERLRAQTVAVPADAGAIDTIWIDGIVPLETPYTTIVGGVELQR